MKNIEDIKNIFYINLDVRIDRRTRFEEEMKHLGLQANRFSAIKHKSGAIGCSMSHITLLKYARDNNLDHIVIMEDDITFLNKPVFINSLNPTEIIVNFNLNFPYANGIIDFIINDTMIMINPSPITTLTTHTIVQYMIYIHLANLKNKEINKVIVYNPLLGENIKFDIDIKQCKKIFNKVYKNFKTEINSY